MPPTSDDLPDRAAPSTLPGTPLAPPSMPARWAMIWVVAAASSAADEAVIDTALCHGYDFGQRLLGRGAGEVEICRPESVDVVAAALTTLVLRPEAWRLIATLTPEARAATDGLAQRLLDVARPHLAGPALVRRRSLTSMGVKLGLLLALTEGEVASIGGGPWTP